MVGEAASDLFLPYYKEIMPLGSHVKDPFEVLCSFVGRLPVGLGHD